MNIFNTRQVSFWLYSLNQCSSLWNISFASHHSVFHASHISFVHFSNLQPRQFIFFYNTNTLGLHSDLLEFSFKVTLAAHFSLALPTWRCLLQFSLSPPPTHQHLLLGRIYPVSYLVFTDSLYKQCVLCVNHCPMHWAVNDEQGSTLIIKVFRTEVRKRQK